MKAEDVRQYLPMPRIWLKMLVSLVVKLLAGGAFLWVFRKDIATHPYLVYFFGFLILVALGFYWFGIVFDGRNPIYWLGEFWRRNIRGYVLGCFYQSDGGVVYEILPPGISQIVAAPAFFLPLGGILSRLRQKQTCVCCPWGWRAKFAGIERGHVTVKLIDREGGNLRLPAPQALWFLNEEFFSGNQAGGRWSGALNSLLVERDVYQKQVDEAWRKIDALEWHVNWLRRVFFAVCETRRHQKNPLPEPEYKIGRNGTLYWTADPNDANRVVWHLLADGGGVLEIEPGDHLVVYGRERDVVFDGGIFADSGLPLTLVKDIPLRAVLYKRRE